jgi:DNA-binding NarL/FixJ family response regulator
MGGQELTSRRVVLVNLSQMLRELLEEAFAHAPGLDVVAASDGCSLAHAACETQAELLVTETPDSASGELDELLRRLPRLRVIVLAESGRRAVLVEMRPARVPLGELTPADLLAMAAAPAT